MDHRPTVKNISKGQKARRKSAASKHARGVSELDQVQNIRPYLDAAEIKGRPAIAWFRPNDTKKMCKMVHSDVSVQDAKLQVILLALEKGTDRLPRRETT